MTYTQFIVFFLAPAVLLGVVILAARLHGAPPATRKRIRHGLVVTAVLVVVAVGYTMPWDRWLILNAVWSYPPGSVVGVIASVPVEEYLFMIGQTVLAGCWTLVILREDDNRPVRSSRWPLAALAWILAAGGGAVWAVVSHRALYLGAILGWFGPLLALQSVVGADILRERRRSRLTALALTPVLWAADAIAIHLGAWRLNPTLTVGLDPFGLPVEEALFFLVTTALVVNSIVLVTAPALRMRMTRWSGRLADRREPTPVPDQGART